ncbi:MAG: TIGR03067 domain-containing protein [Acidobacteria bacterium]|nr:TIGR03067 domain-containing protein [Acidobacteriota bacterium]
MRSLIRVTLVALVVAGSAVWVGAQQAEVPKALVPLQGKWVVDSFNGQAMPPEMGEMALVITGNRYQQLIGGEVTEDGTITVDDTKSPKWIDLNILSGDDSGKKQPGLFEIAGDAIQIGLAMAGNPTRPASFDAAELYVTAKRAK